MYIFDQYVWTKLQNDRLFFSATGLAHFV